MLTRVKREERHPLVVAIFLIAFGLLFGSGAFTFVYAEGDSYLSDDPGACINCHVMQEQYDGWIKGSHTSVAVCNDCHAPHGSMFEKYWSKAVNGFNHSWAFTSGDFPVRIQITPMNLQISEAACRHCHTSITESIDSSHAGAEPLSCIRCHETVGHGP